MSLTVFEGLQSEIFVPITPKSVFTPVKKELKEMRIALATAAGVHLKSDTRFNLAGDPTYREIPDGVPSEDLMVSHGGYDNADVNRDVNAMFPIDRLHELVKAGFLKKLPLYIMALWEAAVTKMPLMNRRDQKSHKNSWKKKLTQLF